MEFPAASEGAALESEDRGRFYLDEAVLRAAARRFGAYAELSSSLG